MRIPKNHMTSMASAGLIALLCLPAQALAQAGLGSAASYAVLAGSTITNTGATSIHGDIGLSPGIAITGIPAGQPTGGSIHAGDVAAAQAQADLLTAYDFLAGMPCGTTMSGVDLGGLTLAPGVYCFSAAALMTGALTLDAQGDTAAVFVFQVSSALTVADLSSVIVSNGAQARHVWWQVGSSASLGLSSVMLGNILAHTSITLNTNASLSGRALAQGGAVTMDTNTIAGFGDAGTAAHRTSWGALKAHYR